MSGRVVDFGGGRTPHEDADVNIDKRNFPETDVLHNLDEGIPLRSNSVEKAYAHNIMEHLRSPFEFMREVIRVCKNGAVVSVRFPFPKHENAVKDPGHRYVLVPRWFDLFEEVRVVENRLHYPNPKLSKFPFLTAFLTPDEYRLKLKVVK